MEGTARSWMPCRVTSSIVQDVKICCDSRPRRSSKPGCCLMKKSGSVASGSDWYMRIGSGNWPTRLMSSCRRMSRLSSPGWGGSGEPLPELAQTDPAMGDCEQAAAESAIQLKELAGRLRDYAQQLEADPDRQAVVEDRLDLIQRLKKKYGGSVEAVLVTGRRVQEELQLLDNREERTAELTARLDEEARRLRTLAQQLSKKRD